MKRRMGKTEWRIWTEKKLDVDQLEARIGTWVFDGVESLSLAHTNSSHITTTKPVM